MKQPVVVKIRVHTCCERPNQEKSIHENPKNIDYLNTKGRKTWKAESTRGRKRESRITKMFKTKVYQSVSWQLALDGNRRIDFSSSPKVTATAATMGILRRNTLIVDLSVLPKRPDAAEVEKFLEEEIHLQLSDTKNIQLHNVRNCVYIEMVDAETAQRYQNNHHNRRTVLCDGKEYKIPVYVEKESVTVRIHDLPPQMPHTTVLAFVEQYGTPISITRERWRRYFPGVYNGVRILQMKLDRPIPSFVTIEGETTLVTYPNQPRTCRLCGLAVHPKQKCRKQNTNNNNTPASTEPEDGPSKTRSTNAITRPSSSDPAPAPEGLNKTTIVQQEDKNENYNENDENTIDDGDSSAASDPFTEAIGNQKRRLARLKNTTAKKQCQQGLPDASTNISKSNRFDALVELDWASPSDLNSIGNSSGKGEKK